MGMTDVEIDRELAALGLDRAWLTLGVLTEDWLAPNGHWRTHFQVTSARLATHGSEDRTNVQELLDQALYGYLDKRAGLDDATLATMIDLVGSAAPAAMRSLADWAPLTVAQLAQFASHPAADATIRKLVTQKLRIQTLETADDRLEMDVVRLDYPPEGTSPAFVVRSFKFAVIWRRRLSHEDVSRVGALLAKLPAAEQMRCHLPVFGLHLNAGSSDEIRLSICFQCNNAYLDGGGTWTFDGQSDQARELLAFMKRLTPPTSAP
jgi:hypothetical protein